jgi:aryl-alcohol dehydrogenase-like predicted oxidoreductase
MKFKLFGRTGLRVSELALGAMTFGEKWGWGASREVSRQMFDAYVEAGGNFIDTANHYTGGTSEEYVGEFIREQRHRFVVATKYTLNPRPGDPNAGGNQRKSLVQALEGSLRRLATDYIDIYWVHAWDFVTPVDEIMRALDDAVRSGKVLYVGVSDAPAWAVARANTLAELKGWSPFAGLQIQYSLVERTPERELLPMAAELDLAVTAWSPLGGGVLSGKYPQGKERPQDVRFSTGTWGDAFLTQRNFAIVEEVKAVAHELGRSPSQVALAWLAGRRGNVVIPILGARSLGQIQDNLASIGLRLDGPLRERLDRVSSVSLGFPHDFLAGMGVHQMVHGTATVENHRNRR